MFNNYDQMAICNTMDSRLDGQLVTIMGKHTDSSNVCGVIIMFQEEIEGYDPCITLSPYCLKRLGE